MSTRRTRRRNRGRRKERLPESLAAYVAAIERETGCRARRRRPRNRKGRQALNRMLRNNERIEERMIAFVDLMRKVNEPISAALVDIARQAEERRKQRELLSNNMALAVNAGDAFRRYAEASGKHVDSLTDGERRTAFLAAACELIQGDPE